ncbi:DUF396-domain-containing protein [Martensiomyces pterosporus]|nr:DUF396-domain-containing protein [Martensiomyces pterosporus]
MFLGVLSTLGWVFGLLFVVFSVACGLYIISEWVEEYPRQTRKVIQYAVWAVDLVHVLTLADGMSWWRIGLSLAINHVYTLNLATFPLVNLASIAFLGSCGLAIGNHFLWFFYFIGHLGYPFGQVCAFMFFCVWLVPIALFVSLTPVESSLPSSQEASSGGKKMRQNMFKALFSRLKRTDEQVLHTD